MTAEVVNLRRIRKQRARDAAERQAAANRAAHGRSKEEKAIAITEASRLQRALDGAARE